jgi:ribose 5-phosphate isomerase
MKNILLSIFLVALIMGWFCVAGISMTYSIVLMDKGKELASLAAFVLPIVVVGLLFQYVIDKLKQIWQ